MENSFEESLKILKQHLASISEEEFMQEWNDIPMLDYGTFTVENYLELCQNTTIYELNKVTSIKVSRITDNKEEINSEEFLTSNYSSAA